MKEPKFEQAIAALAVAKEDGTITTKEVIWIGSLWLELVGSILADLADPTSSIDRDWAEGVIRSTWNEVLEVLDGIDIPWKADLLFPLVRMAMPMIIPAVVDWLVKKLDEGETYSPESGPPVI